MEESSRINGRFAPGNSGNPGGRPKQNYVISDLARSHTELAIETLAEIAANQKAPPAARVSASEALLNRGWGKPAQSLDAKIENRTVDLGAAHLAALKSLVSTTSARDAKFRQTKSAGFTDRQDTTL